MIPTAVIPTHQQKREAAKHLVRSYFKDDNGDPFELTDGQADIFLAIVTRRQQLRVQVIAPTQYGKSSTIAMGLIVASQNDKETFGVVTGSEPKSQIIMEKVIQHTFDNERWYSKLELDPSEKLDRIRRSRTRKHVTWMGGGGIRTFTADARNRQRVKESLTGFGAKNIIEDEASLIPDDLQAMILRMLGGYADGFLLKIGNPFYRNHFLRTWQDDRYKHVFIDYHQAIREGRYTQTFVDEMRGEAFFDVLYECKFPEDDEINEAGYRRLVRDAELEAAFEQAEIEPPKGPARLGVDVAAGGKNFTTYVLRYDNVMRLLEKNRDPDLMAQVPRVEKYMQEYGIDPAFVSIDDVGVGHGLTNRLMERGHAVNAVKAGAPAVDSAKFTNVRAEINWLLAEWIKNGGKIVKDSEFYQITVLNYKEDSSSRLKIEPKADMAKRGIPSPDVADGAALTFSNSIVVSAGDFDII